MKAFKTFRAYFFRGLAALLPTILTIWIFVQCYKFVQQNISVHINRGLVQVLVSTVDWYPPVGDEQIRKYVVSREPELQGETALLLEAMEAPQARRGARIMVAEQYWVEGPGQVVGFILALVGVWIVGLILASVVGRALWHRWENMVMRTPLLRRIYPYIKQVTDLLFTEKRLSFLRVVAVEYPRKASWSVGFVTGSGLEQIGGGGRKEFLTIFVPTSPTPFTGYVIMVPREETIELAMSVEEALRFTVSGGVITPEGRVSEQARLAGVKRAEADEHEQTTVLKEADNDVQDHGKTV